MVINVSTPLSTTKKRFPLKLVIAIIIVILAVCATGIILWFVIVQKTSPVPRSIRQSVPFSVYYPDQYKLPRGYTLDLNSFRSSSQAVIYTVSYADSKKLVFSLQKKLSDNGMSDFYAHNMPLRINVSTAVGTAAIGSINTQSVVSLPTTGNTWLLITAPSAIDQTQLKQVVESIKKSG